MTGGIKIEPYRRLDVRTPAVPGGGYIRVDASAASPGKFGPSGLIKDILGTGQDPSAAMEAVTGKLARDDEAAVKIADTRLGETEQALLFDAEDGYFNSQGEAALTKAPEVLEQYSKAQEREVEALPNDPQRQMFEALAQRRMETFGAQVERHSAAERLRWHDMAGDRRIALVQADAGFYWSDDALLRRALGTARAEVRDKAERHGWDSPLTEAALRQQTSRTLVSAIEAAVERDPGRAQALRTRYEQHIEATDRAGLDALLSEAQTRQRAQAASTAILNATPPDGEQATPQWRLRQAEAIADPAVRAATLRHLRSAAAVDEARARTLAEQVLARVLKDGLTESSQIPVREWVALDAEHRQAIETRLDHNARGTEPAANPALVDDLATEMTQTPHVFARRDLVPAVAHLPLPPWQRFHNWQTGLRRDDPATEDQLYAVKRGLQLANKMLPPDVPGDVTTNYRAALVEEIDTWRRIRGKSLDDADIAGMLARYVPTEAHTTHTLEWDPRVGSMITPLGFVPPRAQPSERPGIHRAQSNRVTAPSAAAIAELRALAVFAERAIVAAQRTLADAAFRLAEAQAAMQRVPAGNAVAARAAAQAVRDTTRALEAIAKEHAELREWKADLEAAMVDWSYEFSGMRFPPRIAQKNEIAEAARLGFVPTDTAPIDAQGRQVFVNPDTGEYIVRAIDPRTPGAWELFDANLRWQGFRDYTLAQRHPDPPLKDYFPHAMAMTPEQKEYQKKLRGWQKLVAAMKAGGAADADLPSPPEDPDETPEAKARRQQEADAKAAAEQAARERYTKLGKEHGLDGDSANTRRILDNLDTNLQTFVSRHKNAHVARELDTGMLQNRTVRDALNDPIQGSKVRKILLQLRFE